VFKLKDTSVQFYLILACVCPLHICMWRNALPLQILSLSYLRISAVALYWTKHAAWNVGHPRFGFTWSDAFFTKICAKNNFHNSTTSDADHWVDLPVTPQSLNIVQQSNRWSGVTSDVASEGIAAQKPGLIINHLTRNVITFILYTRTRGSAIAERPRDAACCWVFWLVDEDCSK